MPVFRITGLPIELNVKKQLHALRGYLRRCEVEKFWINEIADTRGTDLKEAGLEVPSDEDGFILESFVNKVPYRKAGIPYFLKAKIVNNDYQDHKRVRTRSPHSSKGGRRSREHSYDRYSPQRNSHESFRSHSPLYQDTTNQMDVELEFLRKKRQLIEEERRLIAEKKKLEMMKEYGDLYEHENSAASRERDVRPKWEKAPERQTRVPTLPLFVVPSKMIMKQLKPLINNATLNTIHERQVLITFIRGQLRRRLALVLKDCDFMPAPAIVEKYRSSHPVLEDEAFVAKMLECLRLSLWPIKIIPEKPKPKQKPIQKNTAGAHAGNVVKKVPKPKKIPAAIKKEAVDPATNNNQRSTAVVKAKTDVIKSETPTTMKSESIEVVKSELNATANEELIVLDNEEDTTDWSKDDMTDMVEFESRPDAVDQAGATTGETAEAVASCGETAEPVVTCGETAEAVATCGEATKDVSTCGEIAEAVATFGETAKVVATCGETAEDVSTCGETAKAVATCSETAKPVETAGETAGAVATCGETAEAFATCGEMAWVAEDDWVTNGIEWDDDGDVSKDDDDQDIA